jgi:hypothetical protein
VTAVLRDVTPAVASPTTLAEALDFYERHGVPVTPVRPGEKKGYRKGWSMSGHGSASADFRLNDNVGVLNATKVTTREPYYYFHDVDIDANSNAARSIVEQLLPPTGWRYGRASKPRSHCNYLVTAPLRTRKYVGIDGNVILELRGITQKKTHTLSVAPGSTHESGEGVRFEEPRGDIGRVDTPEHLDTAVQHAAVGIVILQVWPANNRHRLRLAFAKVLLETGMASEKVAAILQAVMRVTGSDVQDVQPAVRSTDDALHASQPTEGAAAILDVLGEETGRAALGAIARILRSHAADDGKCIVVNEPTTEMVDRAWVALTVANDPPGLFRRQDEIVILRNSSNTCLEQLYGEQLKLTEPTALQHVPGFRTIDTDTFREIVGRMVPCVLADSKGGQRTKVFPTREFANLMLASPALPLPEPLGFTPVPFFTPEGRLVTTPGLHRDTGMFYQPPPGFVLPEIADTPTRADVAKAVAVIDEMVWQFPFKGREGMHPYADMRDGCDWRRTAAYANMLAFPLTVLTRSLFHAVPLFLFDKPTTRTGASLLVQCWSYVLTGAWPSEAEWDGNESERRKFLTAILITGAPIIFLDEVKDLKSPDLNKILTGKGARIGRVLGRSEITNPRNFSTFVATGNNPTFPKDMAGRMCRVRLDADMVKPSGRVGWNKDLMQWVPENRVALLTSLYVLVRAWFANGRPPNDAERVLNGFEPWSYTLGGILTHAELTEFLANKRDVEDDAEDEEADDVDALLVAWATRYPNAVVTTPKVLELECVPIVDGEMWGARQLGNWLRVNRDKRRMLTDGREVRIVREPGEGRWRLRVLARPEDGGLPLGPGDGSAGSAGSRSTVAPGV